jgi:hypothetical protein
LSTGRCGCPASIVSWPDQERGDASKQICPFSGDTALAVVSIYRIYRKSWYPYTVYTDSVDIDIPYIPYIVGIDIPYIPLALVSIYRIALVWIYHIRIYS